MVATTQPREQASPDMNKPDTLAALLCCLYEGPEIELAATMLIEQAMELEELRASPVAAPEAPTREQADGRADFEAYIGPCDLRQFADGSYVDTGVNKAWGGWQAGRAALTRQAAPEAPDSEQQAQADRVVEWSASYAATTASASDHIRTVVCSDSTVYVCAERDIECGQREDRWCAVCPKRHAPAPSTTASTSGEPDAWGLLTPDGRIVMGESGPRLPLNAEDAARGVKQVALYLRAPAPSRNAAPSASEPKCKTCHGTGYFYEDDSEVGQVARECEGCDDRTAALSREATPRVKTWQERFTRFGGPSKDVAMQAEIDELRAALTQQSAAQAPSQEAAYSYASSFREVNRADFDAGWDSALAPAKEKK